MCRTRSKFLLPLVGRGICCRESRAFVPWRGSNKYPWRAVSVEMNERRQRDGRTEAERWTDGGIEEGSLAADTEGGRLRTGCLEIFFSFVILGTFFVLAGDRFKVLLGWDSRGG